MYYFSELRRLKVYGPTMRELGIVGDAAFEVADYPLVKKILIKKHKGSPILIDLKDVQDFNGKVVLREGYKQVDLNQNELFIAEGLLDKQIIDLANNKVVRVNDVVVQEKKNEASFEMVITGVDIGFLGLLRRLRVERLALQIANLVRYKAISTTLSWADIQQLELKEGVVKLKLKAEKLKAVHPEDLADHLEKTSEKNVRGFISMLGLKQASEVIKHLDIEYQRDLFENWPAEQAVKFINLIDDDETVDILLTLTEEKREEIIELMPMEEREKIRHLLAYSNTPIGSRMTTDYIIVPTDITTQRVYELVRQETGTFFFLSSIFVVNDRDQLVGVFNLHELAMQAGDTPVFKFMETNVIVARLTTPIEIVIKQMLKYHISSIPVIDKNRNILGIVTLDDTSDLLLEKIA